MGQIQIRPTVSPSSHELFDDISTTDHKKYAESIIEVVFNQRKPPLLKSEESDDFADYSSKGKPLETFKARSDIRQQPEGK